MKITKITIDPDPYEPFRLAQGYRAGDLLFISGQAAIDGTGQLVGIGNFDVQAERVSQPPASSQCRRFELCECDQGHNLSSRYVELSENRRASGSLFYASVSGRYDRRSHIALFA